MSRLQPCECLIAPSLITFPDRAALVVFPLFSLQLHIGCFTSLWVSRGVELLQGTTLPRCDRIFQLVVKSQLSLKPITSLSPSPCFHWIKMKEVVRRKLKLNSFISPLDVNKGWLRLSIHIFPGEFLSKGSTQRKAKMAACVN